MLSLLSLLSLLSIIQSDYIRYSRHLLSYFNSSPAEACIEFEQRELLPLAHRPINCYI